MTLRKKAFIIVTGTALALIATLFLLGRRIIIDGVLRVEEETITLDVLRVIDAINADLDRIESNVRDYANRDDTYQYMLDRNAAYIQDNLADEVFRNFKVSLIALVDLQGRIVHARALDYATGADLPHLVEEFAAELARDPRMPQGGGHGRKGILLLPEGNLFLSASPIKRSDWDGPSRGTLVFARLLDADQLARTARITHLSARIQPLADADLPGEVLSALRGLDEASPVVVRPLGPRKVAGYTLIKDLADRTALVLAVEELRGVYVQGERSFLYYRAALVVTGLAFGILVAVLLEREVLSRLLLLSGRVREIGRSRDLSQRVAVSGGDELAALAAEVNGTLAQLQESETALRHTRDQLEERVRERTAELETVNESLRGQIRERVRAEDALRQVKEELEQQNVELRKLDRMKDALISDVSHELRTPVAKHAMQLELLRGKLVRHGLEEDLGGLLRVMDNSVRRQRSVISNILTLSRLEAGGRVCCFGPVRLDELLAEVVEDYQHALAAYGIVVVRTLEPVTVTSDRELLWHVFSNLVNNAIKYRGRVAPRIEITAVREGDRVRVLVADNGIGLSRETLERIFERFYQESASAEGIGLGLHIVRMILDRLGGDIALRSPGAGLGSAAEVVLPREPPVGGTQPARA